MKNFGKLIFSPETVSILVSPLVEIDVPDVVDQAGNVVSPGRKEVVPERRQDVQIMVLRNADGIEWHHLFKQFPHPWYIAVQSDGTIISMESDPEQSQITNCELWGIDSNFSFTRGTGGTVYGKIWDGKKITSRPVIPQNIPLSADQFYSLLDTIGKLDQFTAAIETVSPTAKKMTCRNQFNNSVSFTWDMILMSLVAPIVWGVDWQSELTQPWVASAQLSAA